MCASMFDSPQARREYVRSYKDVSSHVHVCLRFSFDSCSQAFSKLALSSSVRPILDCRTRYIAQECKRNQDIVMIDKYIHFRKNLLILYFKKLSLFFENKKRSKLIV